MLDEAHILTLRCLKGDACLLECRIRWHEQGITEVLCCKDLSKAGLLSSSSNG